MSIPQIQQTKASLLNAARSGAARPAEGSTADERLRRCIDPQDPCFDPDFVDSLREIDPDWVVSSRLSPLSFS